MDITKLPLRELATLENPRLKKSLREVVDQVDKQHEIVAGFGSAI